MNGKFLSPLTGLNDFDILGAAPIIREKNKREANVNKPTPELSAHGGTKNKSRRYGTPAITYFYATGSLFIASDGDDGRRKGIILLTDLPFVRYSVSAR